jgi:CBS domain-containing protein/DNA-directed RNA polymerase specialized sigma24 family protein
MVSLNERTITPYLNRKVLVLDVDTPAQEAARAMYERRVGSVVLSDARGELVGLITDRDLACQILGFGLAGSTPIREAVGSKLVAVDEGAPLSKAIEAMEEHGVRRIPVIRETPQGRQKCVGIVTLDDLLVSEALPPERFKRIVRSQVLSGARRRLLSRPGSSEHSENRKEDTLNRFHAIMARKMGLENERGGLESAVFSILSDLIRRLPYTQAAHLIAQLPRLLQEDLLDLPAGPDPAITARWMVRGVQAQLGVLEDRARAALHGFWAGFAEFLKQPQELQNILETLPEDFREAFVEHEVEGNRPGLAGKRARQELEPQRARSAS